MDTTLGKPLSYRGSRRAVQLGALLMLVLLPAMGVFRIDLARGSLMVLGRLVNLRDFPVVAGLAIVLATAPLLMVSTIGTLWCGWACPQNTVSEWANGLTRRLLGSRASVDVEAAGLEVAPSKDRIVNWLSLGARLVLASLVLGIVPLFYFFPPEVVWSLLRPGEQNQFSEFIHRLYFVSAGAAFVDMALVRYFLCNYACLYRMGLLLFRGKGAMRIAYEGTRSGECAKCNYCRVSCLTGIDPTSIKAFDRCINCAECVDACSRLQVRRKRGVQGLLRLELVPLPATGRTAAWVDRVLASVGWHGLLFLAGCASLAYGLVNLPS